MFTTPAPMSVPTQPTQPTLAVHGDDDHDCCAFDLLRDWMNLIAYTQMNPSVYVNPDHLSF